MKFSLRKWKESDVESVCKYANNINIAKYLRDSFSYPYTMEDAKNYVIDYAMKCEDKRLCLAIDINGEAIGSIAVFVKEDVYKKSAEIGYWLAEEYWGKGIMSSAIKQICEMAFSKFDIVRIYAEPFAHNQGSRKALEKAGFKLEGILKKSVYKNKELFDSCIYAILR